MGLLEDKEGYNGNTANQDGLFEMVNFLYIYIYSKLISQ